MVCPACKGASATRGAVAVAMATRARRIMRVLIVVVAMRSMLRGSGEVGHW